MLRLAWIILGLLLFHPGVVAAQTATTPAHPALPWSLGPAIPQGQLLRYVAIPPGVYIRDIWIPPQSVVVDMVVTLPSQAADVTSDEAPTPDTQPKEEAPYGVLRETFVVPGYYVRETTVGFQYPERWVLDQSYRWQLLPAEFQRRPSVDNPGPPPPPLTVPSLGSRGSPPPPVVVPSLR
jgi:hypothetical protein